MKIVSLISFISITLLSPITIASEADHTKEGHKLFTTHCSQCHGIQGGMDMSKRVAPPIMAVRMHYIGTHPDKKSFVTAVTGWVKKQDENKSLMLGAIRKFNIMPPISISQADAEKIAAYIYNGQLEKPDGMEEHINEMHGNKHN